MRSLPIFMTVAERSVIVVGGGAAAAAKVRLLLRASAAVTVVAPRLGREIAGLAAVGYITVRSREFVAGDLTGAALVYGATGLREVDARVAEAARAEGVPVNVVDRPELSDFSTPAIVDRDPVVIGISTGGAAPVLARRLRALIDSVLPGRVGRLAAFAASFRPAAKAKIADAPGRRRFWETLIDGPVANAVLRGDDGLANRLAVDLLNREETAARAPGVVHIVGAGPGDPDLLTLRALRLLQQADVIVHDKLVGSKILDLARRDAERFYVGKSKNRYAISQDRINRLLVAQAQLGRQVVRLKGGDPFVFGRGGEELDYLLAHGVAVTVVPGITAATGCAAAAGIPLTHRDHAGAVTFVSGHSKDGEPELDWSALARARQTLVVYMGLSTAGLIARRLIDHGMKAATPVAVIGSGTLPDEKTVTGRLGDLETLIADSGIDAPALIVIGDVVRRKNEVAVSPPPADEITAIAV